jgi:hypothetical protein
MQEKNMNTSQIRSAPDIGDDDPDPQLDDFQDYLWSDLMARRIGIGLMAEEFARATRAVYEEIYDAEAGDIAVRGRLVNAAIAMEQFVADETARLIADAGSFAEGETVELQAIGDQDQFNAAYPDARTKNGAPLPFTLQHVALGRAAAELTRRGAQVDAYRGDCHAELACRRQAVGLGKAMAAKLLGVRDKKYDRWENDARLAPSGAGGGASNRVPRGLIAELQAMDDFIATTAAALPVGNIGDTSVVYVIDDQEEFERVYPQARTHRDGTPYPRRVLFLAAARRASELARTGRQVRIAVADD